METTYKGYNLKINKYGLEINGTGVPLKKSRIILSFGKPAIQKLGKDATNKEIKNAGGEVYNTSIELMVEAFKIEEKKVIEMTTGVDVRSQKYLSAVKANIGLKEIKHGYDGIKFNKEFGLKMWANLTGSGMVDCGKTSDGDYVAEYCIRTDIDDYDICSLIFKELPTKKKVETAETLEKIKYYLSRRRSPYFKCWECGRKSHWLDVFSPEELTLEARFDMFKDEYCGC